MSKSKSFDLNLKHSMNILIFFLDEKILWCKFKINLNERHLQKQSSKPPPLNVCKCFQQIIKIILKLKLKLLKFLFLPYLKCQWYNHNIVLHIDSFPAHFLMGLKLPACCSYFCHGWILTLKILSERGKIKSTVSL